MSHTPLQWDVLTIKRPGLSRDIPAGTEDLMWVANSATLIYGEKDAVLVDTFLTKEQSQTLLEWVIASGKNLTTIYITHGHGDHFFGLAPLLKHFPEACAVAAPAIVNAMHAHLAPASVDGFWRKLFPGEIDDTLIVAEALHQDSFELEGHTLSVVHTGRTDTAESTSLFVPSIGLLVAGDVVYNGIHPYLGETDTQSRLEWIAALDALDALNPSHVVAGHKVPENNDSPDNIGKTKQYLQDFNRLADETHSAEQLYQAMLTLYPTRVNPGSLWKASVLTKPAA